MAQPFPLAPATYLCAPGALAALPDALTALGGRVLVVHGERGYALIQARIASLLGDAGLPSGAWQLRGPCSAAAIADAGRAMRAFAADVVLAVGGGRVMDVAKAAAIDASLPYVTVPTSPATCAAVRAHSVLYSESGLPAGVRPLPRNAAACLVDLDVLAAAPARLLAAGLLDAAAKWYELDLLHSRRPLVGAAPLSGHLLAQGIRDRVYDLGPKGVAAIAAGAAGSDAHSAIEVAVLLPGLVSGLLAGDGSMLVAHAVHNALLHLPEAHRSLHGELVGFGLVVQALLLDPGSAEAERIAGLIRALRGPRTLADLGASAALDPAGGAGGDVAALIAADPATERAFGALPRARVVAALAGADALLS
jgi:glycerol dehydrogenase-like iron-containing ADH family enzyme